jgi:cerevisin
MPKVSSSKETCWLFRREKLIIMLSLSLGAFYSQPTNDAITEAIGLGIHFSIAAGNYGEDACRYSPGSTPGAITVGAFDEDDSVSYYSNFGKCVDM